MKILKNKLLLIIIASIVVMIIAIGSIITLVLVNNNATQKSNIPTKTSANNLKKEAISAYKNNDLGTAIKLFKNAHKQYEVLGDTNNIVTTEAQINYLESQSKDK